VQPEGANWMVRGKLARLGGDLKGNPFKSVVDLIPHEDMKMKRDVSARGMAESMLHFQICVNVLDFQFVSFVIYCFLSFDPILSIHRPLSNHCSSTATSARFQPVMRKLRP
jgi:hypothetical protein